MKTAHRRLVAFAADTRGATAIEYALIAVLIAVGAIGALMACRDALGARMAATAQAFAEAGAKEPGAGTD